jgi:hypothetical protein
MLLVSANGGIYDGTTLGVLYGDALLAAFLFFPCQSVAKSNFKNDHFTSPNARSVFIIYLFFNV